MRLLLALFTLFVFSMHPLAAVTVEAFKLIKMLPHKKWQKGKVVPIRSGCMRFQNAGYLTFVATEGAPVRGPQYNKAGEIIKEGTLIAQQDKSLYEIDINIKERLIDAATAELNTSLREYKRMKLLMHKSAVSKKDFDDAEENYLTIIARLAQAEREQEKAKYNLRTTSMHAPFTGVIKKVYCLPASLVNPDIDVLELTMMSSMKIEIKIPYELSKLLVEGKSIDVYPSNSKQAYPGWFYPSFLSGEKAFIYVENHKKPLIEPSAQEKSMPRITGFWGIQRLFDASDEILHIPEDSLHEDNGSCHVWRLAGQSAYDGKPLPRIVKTEKIPVKKGRKFYSFPYGAYYEVKNSKLKLNDVLAVSTDGDLKDNCEAVVLNMRWIFSPNETVDVKLPDLAPRDYYIPRRFILQDNSGNDFFYTVDKRKKIVKVYVKTQDVLGSLVRVSGRKLTPDMPVVISNLSLRDTGNPAPVKVKFVPHPEIR